MLDIHTHGIGGVDTRTTSENDILHMAEMHGSHGVSEIIPAVYPSSIETMRENMLAIKNSIKKQNHSEEKTAKITGIHLEGPFLNPSKCGALDEQSFLKPNVNDLRKLIDGFEDIIKIITIAPELDGACELISHISDAGIIASMGHSDATYIEAESGYHAGARGITHIFNAMRGIHHREPGLAGFGLMNHEIYIELIADPFHLDTRIIEFIFAVKNTGRIIIVSDTVRDAHTTSHSERIRNESNTLLGGSMTIRESSERLIQLGINKEAVLKAISENPGRYLGN